MSTILIARHGNTFEAGVIATRVGLKTDLPLAGSGRVQAENLGLYLKQHNIQPEKVYVSNLKRTQEMANIALQTANLNIKPIENSMFNEIDYGPDEGKTNEQVIERIGETALNAWEDSAIPPPGWLVDTNKIIKDWQDFANMTQEQQTVLVVTSNGIARFAPYLTEDFLKFSLENKIKLATGAIGSLTRHDGIWKIDFWNETPRAR